MAEDYDRADMNTLVSEDEVYVTRLSNSKLSLMNFKDEDDSPLRLDPEDAPLYMNIATGEAIYHPETSENIAEQAAEHAMEKTERGSCELVKDGERWEEEFSEIIDQDIDLGEARTEQVDPPADGSPRRYI